MGDHLIRTVPPITGWSPAGHRARPLTPRCPTRPSTRPGRFRPLVRTLRTPPPEGAENGPPRSSTEPGCSLGRLLIPAGGSIINQRGRFSVGSYRGTLELMPGFFPVLFFVGGALFVVEGGLSLVRGRAVVVVPRLWGKPPCSTWEFWSQLLFGIAFVLAAIAMLPSRAQVPAALGAVLFSSGSLVGLILGTRSFQSTSRSPD